MAIKTTGVWPLNSAGEIILQAGTGDRVVAGYLDQNQIPTDETTSLLVVRLPDPETQDTETQDLSEQFAGLGLLITSEGEPPPTWRAVGHLNPEGDDNRLAFTAVEYGEVGNSISVEYVDPGANDQSISVSVVGSQITVSLATDESGTITSTAADVIAAIESSTPASALVTVEGWVDNFIGENVYVTGVVTAMDAVTLELGQGIGVNVARPGCLCIDIINGYVYRNSGTKAVPVWTKLADA
jgi:hypothetical protein